jgi:hypothetical protein
VTKKVWQYLSGDSNSITIVEESEKMDQRQRSRPSHLGSENNVVIINIDMIINGMNLLNETPRKSIELLDEVTKFNLNVMKIGIPFLPYPCSNIR